MVKCGLPLEPTAPVLLQHLEENPEAVKKGLEILHRKPTPVCAAARTLTLRSTIALFCLTAVIVCRRDAAGVGARRRSGQDPNATHGRPLGPRTKCG
jgi:hypothetical protein